MIFSEIFIRKPITTILVMMSALIFGVAAFINLPVSDLPVVDYPVITINVSYPGASPEMMASTVATPLENECMQIQGLQTIISDNTEGQTKITLTFNLDRNVDLCAPDVQAAISNAQGNLPDDLPQPPTYTKDNPSDMPIMHVSVTSDTLTMGQLYDFGNTIIAQRVNMVEGVSKVDVWGTQSAVRVQVDPDKLASYGIGIDEISQAVKAGTVIIPAGSIDGKLRAFTIEPEGQLLNAQEYQNLIVAYRNGAAVYMRDIANVIDSTQNDVVRVMHKTAEGKWDSVYVHVAVSRESGANTVAVAKNIRNIIEELKQEIPGSVHVDIMWDRSIQIVESVNDVKSTVFIALALVVLVIFLFIGRLDDTIIPSVTLPFTIFATFVFMFFAKFSLDNLSLMGLTLSVGFLVDDAIVVLENTVRHVEAGEKPLRAAINSMKEISGTVVSTSFALITVFIPLVFMSGVVGSNFKELALTVIAAIAASTIIALTLAPMLCAHILKEVKKGSTKGKTRMELKIEKIVDNIVAKYGIALKWVLEHKFLSIVGWVLCVAGTVWFMAILPKTFLPIGDSGAIMGMMQAPLGTSTDQIRGMQDQLNEILADNPSVDKIVTATGLQAGADQSTGLFYAILKDRNAKGREPMDEVVNELRSAVAKIVRGFVFIEPIPALQISTGGESTASGSLYSYIIKGEIRDQVYNSAIELEKKMWEIEGISDVQNSVKLSMPQLNLIIDRDRASSLGITAEDIENGLSLAFAQGKTTLYKTDIDQYYVIVELEKKFQKVPMDLERLYIRSSGTNKLVPLVSIARWEEGVGPQDVPHLNRLNAATLSFNIRPEVPLGNVTEALKDAAADILPAGISGTFQGLAQEFEDSVKSMTVLLLISIFIMYIILGILYESYIHPLTVLTTLPPATLGGLATLLIFRSELSLYAYIGMFMLLGIVSKNGIIMVDFATQNLEEGTKSDFDAIYNACMVRFRPILMTGASTIIGAMPIALGFGADGASRRPLGLIVAGGLIFAQAVTLFITPALFLYMQQIQEKVLDRFDLLRSGAKRKIEEAGV